MTIEVIIMVVVGIVVLALVGALLRAIGDILADVLEVFLTGVKATFVVAAIASAVYFAHYLMV